MNRSNHILKVVDVEKTFQSKGFFKKKKVANVLKGVSININYGETVALVGESGSGKSTLARLILGLDNISKGSISFKDKNISSLNKQELKELRKNMQIVFQDPVGSVNPRMNMLNIISEPLYSYGYSRSAALSRVKELLELVGLDERALPKYYHQFSGGQLQRIGIARAIALNPDFLVLDEPTSALDVSVQARILKLFKDLQNRLDLTYLFITHDLNVVQTFADRVLVMCKGEIVESGSVDEIFYKPQHSYTKLLLNSNLLGKSDSNLDITRGVDINEETKNSSVPIKL